MAGNEPITRDEFEGRWEMFLRWQEQNTRNVTEQMAAINATLGGLSEKMDEVKSCTADRVTWTAFDRFRDEHALQCRECNERFKAIETTLARPPTPGWVYWVLSALLIIATGLTVYLITNL